MPLARLLNYGIIACLATRVQGKTMQRPYPVTASQQQQLSLFLRFVVAVWRFGLRSLS